MSEAKPGFGQFYFNPSLLDKKELIDGFIARRGLLDELLDSLRQEVEGRPPQHHLLIGQRGMGKSTLLLRLRYAVEDDPELSQIWLPLSFPEEQNNLRTLSDFWLNCLDALGDALEAAKQNELAKSLDKQRDALPKNEEARSEAALALLLEQAEALDRRLILLIDNLDLVFDKRLKSEDWAIRHLLSSEPRLLLIGASSQAMESTYDYGRAFYDFFRTHEVRGLDFEETKEVLTYLAQLHDQLDIKKIVEEQPGRIRTVQTLSGGNPRTIVLLYGVLENGYEGNAKHDLERLLDLYTPLYKARFEELSEQHQQIVDALATHWDPATAATLAETLRMDVNNVSAALTRLEQREGVVEKVDLPGEKKLGFQLAERFFNIWYLMRASRRSRKRLTWLVKFLRLWYDQTELGQQALRLIEQEKQRGGGAEAAERLRYAEYGLALAEALDDRRLRTELEHTSLHALLGGDGHGKAGVGELPEELKTKKQRMDLLDKLRRQVSAMRRDWDGIDPEEFWRLLGGSWALSLAEKRALVKELAGFDSAELKELFVWLQNREQQLKTVYRQHEDAVDALYQALAKGDAEDISDWDNITNKVASYIALDACLFSATRAKPEPALLQKAEAFLSQMAEEDGCRAWGWHGLGNLRQIHQGNDREAEQAYRKAVEIDPGFTRAWAALGELLGRLERHEEAEAAYRGAISSDPGNALAWNRLGKLLQHPRMQRYDEAEDAYRKALASDPANIEAMNNLARLLQRFPERRRGQENPEGYLREALKLDGNDARTWHNLGELQQRQGQLDEAETAYRNAIKLDPKSSWFSSRKLAYLLLGRGDYAKAEQAYWQAWKQTESDPMPGLIAKIDLVTLGREWWRKKKDAEAEAFIARLLGADALADFGDAWLLWAETRADRQDWPEALRGLSEWARRALPQEGKDESPYKTSLDKALEVLALFIRAGRGAAALEVLEANGVQEDWRPLYEAMKAAEAGSGRYLNKVAPEVRQAALEILRSLSPEAAEGV